MKSIDIKDIETLPGRRIEDGDTFQFRCHKELSCFNRCCRNLNLFLYPYDVLRLRKNLGISSDTFIDTYTDVVLRPDNFFPEVLLKMSDTDEKTCPFLKETGCTVYPDRPDACRTFPLEHGLIYDEKGKIPRQMHFFRPPGFCMGQHETTEMTLQTWAEDQQAETYNDMTRRWAEIKSLFHKNPWGTEGPSGQKGKMAFMSAYNMDQFRDFVFNSSFLKRYKVPSGVLKRIKQSDTELLRFGWVWIRVMVWGISSREIQMKK